MIFVSSPYSSADPAVKEERRKFAARYCMNLALLGEAAVSPVVYGLALMADTGSEMPDDFETWKAFCLSMLKSATAVHVLKLDGWVDSYGVRKEVEFAVELGIPIEYVDPENP